MSTPADGAGGAGAIGGDPGTVEAGAREVATAGGRVKDAGADVRQHADTVMASWTGASADAAHERLRLCATRAQVAGEAIKAAGPALTTYAAALRRAQRDHAAAVAAADTARDAQDVALEEMRETSGAAVDTLGPAGHRGMEERQRATKVEEPVLDLSEDIAAAEADMASAVAAEALANEIAARAVEGLIETLAESSALALTPGGSAPTLQEARAATGGPEPVVVSSEGGYASAGANVSLPVADIGAKVTMGDEIQTLGDGTFQVLITEAIDASAGRTLPGGAATITTALAAGGQQTQAYAFSSEKEARAFLDLYGSASGRGALASDRGAGTVREPVSTMWRGSLGVSADATVGVDGLGEAEGQAALEGAVEVTVRPDGSYDVAAEVSASAAASAGLAQASNGLTTEGTVRMSTSFDEDGRATAMALTTISEEAGEVTSEHEEGWLKSEGTLSVGRVVERTRSIDLPPAGEPSVAGTFADAALSGDPRELVSAGQQLTRAVASARPETTEHLVAEATTETTLGTDAAGVALAHGRTTSTLVP